MSELFETGLICIFQGIHWAFFMLITYEMIRMLFADTHVFLQGWQFPTRNKGWVILRYSLLVGFWGSILVVFVGSGLVLFSSLSNLFRW